MGSLLREVLKSICAGNGWTYAVFWKPKQRNPMILAWEEGHFEQGLYPGQFGSATGSQSVLLGEWELSHQRNSGSRSSGNDRLDVLFSKMRDQVHVIGKGIVGKVSLTGTHRWVFQDTCMDEGYLSGSIVYGTSFENSAEWYHQFSAGIQTVAIISVSPLGVLQCGSVKRIGESKGFVNIVRNIFMQFGVNSASSLEIMPMVSGQNVNLPKFSDVYGVNRSADICHVKMEGPETSLSEIPGEPICQPSSFLSNDLQTCNSLLETLGGAICANDSTVPSVSCSVIPSTEAFGDLFQQKALLPVKPPNSLLRDQLEFALTGGTTAAVLDPSMQLNQHMSQISAKSCGCVNNLQQQSVPNNIPLLDCTVFPKHEIDENKMLTPPDISSGLISNRSDIVNSRTGIREPVNSDPSVLWKLVHTHRSPFPQSTGLQYADLASVPLSSGDSKELCDVQINSSRPGVPRTSNNAYVIDGHPPAVSTVMPAKVENDLFQAIGLPYNGSSLDKQYPCHGALSNHVANFVQVGSSNDLIPKVNLQPAKTDFEDSLVTVAGSGNSSEKFGCLGEVKLNTSSATLQLPSGNHVLGQLHSDLKNNECQSGCSSIYSQLKHAENTYTRPDFSSCTSDLNIASILKAFGDGHIDNSSFSENRSENLLDAIVTSVRSYSDRSSNLHTSGKAVSTKIGSSHTEATSFELLTVSEKKHEAACVAQHLLNSKMVMPNYCSLSECSVSRTAEGSQTDGASKSQVSMKMESSNLQHDNTLSMHSGRAEESAKGKQKRPKPGESTRPRPKDRQQIQDRVKELREIVPNGAKCSIDALLERTIKHMLFLQSVTKHADKLKQTGESKLISKDGGLLLKDNFEGGATWAFEVGSKSMVCPIIVEDLNVPRQMLVEMLCEERGFFLEIADMIRGMGLTILKGVMETRDDKIWAHFAVEANRDITRMEVFMSLVHLLEQISNSRPPKTMTGGLPTFDSYHRSSIPAAGSMERLQ